jgi:hypothetical protein
MKRRMPPAGSCCALAGDRTMSLLNFLRIVDQSDLYPADRPPASRQRKLALETLDSRALLTLFTPILTDSTAELIEIDLPPDVQFEPVSGDPGAGAWVPDPPNEPLPEPEPSSGGGEGGAAPLDPVGDPPPDPLAGSGGGEGGDPPLDPQTGSGSGSGEGQPPANSAPAIASASYIRVGDFVTITGIVGDDGPLGGLTVYFSSDLGHQFTTQTSALGAFCSLSLTMEPGTQISIYTVDAAGNQSEYYLLLL